MEFLEVKALEGLEGGGRLAAPVAIGCTHASSWRGWPQGLCNFNVCIRDNLTNPDISKLNGIGKNDLVADPWEMTSLQHDYLDAMLLLH